MRHSIRAALFSSDRFHRDNRKIFVPHTVYIGKSIVNLSPAMAIKSFADSYCDGWFDGQRVEYRSILGTAQRIRMSPIGPLHSNVADEKMME